MKKFIAVTVVVMMMFAFAASSFALVAATTATSKNPPVFIDGLVVSDAWMSGLTMQNWQASLTNQAYAEGSYIWFIAKLGVSAEGDTEAEYLWDGRDQTAELTMTGKDNCLNFSSANMATLARISGMSIDARAINNSNLGIVEATANKVKYTFTNLAPALGSVSVTSIDSNRVLSFASRLEALQLDPIVPADTYAATVAAYPAPIANYAGVANTGNRATLQKDYYLHFMAITKAATEGVCVGTMKVNGTDTFDRWGGVATASTYETYNWYSATATKTSSTQLEIGDRSEPHMLYNTYNRQNYSVIKIKNGNGAVGGQFSNRTDADRGPWGGVGDIYVVMNSAADKVVCAFVVDGSTFKGLAKWNYDNWKTPNGFSMFDTTGSRSVLAVDGSGVRVPNGALPWNYEAISSNDYSGNAVEVAYTASNGTAVTKGELQGLFDFFGFGYANPNGPGDADFLARSGLTTVAEAKYNVANAVIATPDQNIVVPKTGDAATSTGLILVASAILAAAAVGFVLSKRAHN